MQNRYTFILGYRLEHMERKNDLRHLSVYLGKPRQKCRHICSSLTYTAQVGSVNKLSTIRLQRTHSDWKRNRSNFLLIYRSACIYSIFWKWVVWHLKILDRHTMTSKINEKDVTT